MALGTFDVDSFQGESGKHKIIIREERQFTNPHVRFIRKNGRIIPIINRKRIGQTTAIMGNAQISVGAALTTAGVIKKLASSRLKAKIFGNARLKKIFDTSLNAAKANAAAFTNKGPTRFGKSFPKISKTAKIAVLPIRGAIKRPLTAGLILLGTGLVTRGAGFGVEAESAFGADLF